MTKAIQPAASLGLHPPAISTLHTAAENAYWFVSVNCASPGSPTTSAVVRPDGILLSYQPYGDEGLMVADIDVDEATCLLATRCRTE